MTSLRQRMTQDLQLRGYSDRTVEAYVRAVAQLATFYHTPPDRLCEEQIRQYLLHLSTVQKVARGTHTIALCGITFFYQQTLGHAWTVLDIARPQAHEETPRRVEQGRSVADPRRRAPAHQRRDAAR